jgi:glycosyltransferase involved in cell wall biosynthesis
MSGTNGILMTARSLDSSAPNDPRPCLSVVIPAFNEHDTLRDIVERVLRLPFKLEMIVVDDCSQDDTPVLIADLTHLYPNIRSIRHERNRGKTAAVKTGIAATTGEIVIVQDADLEYDPAEIPDVIGPIVQDRADVVYGSRFLVRKATRVLYFYHYLANRTLTFWCNLFSNMNMTDVETGYKAFRGNIIRDMIITSSGFGFEIEVTAKIAKLGARIYEVPISYYGRTYEEGKKIGAIDGLLAFWYVFKYNVLVSRARSFRTLRPILNDSKAGLETPKVAACPDGRSAQISRRQRDRHGRRLT